jgi:hypothetical protein
MASPAPAAAALPSSPRATPKSAARTENKENSAADPTPSSVRAAAARAAAAPRRAGAAAAAALCAPRRGLTRAAQILKRRRSVLLDVGAARGTGRSPARTKRTRQSLGGRRVSFAPDGALCDTRHFERVRRRRASATPRRQKRS